MPHATRHRGTHREDPELFASAEVARLRTALEEAAWLLGRGYPLSTVVTTVGGHHGLVARQRLALQRAACSDSQRRERRARENSVAALAGATLHVDGLNLIITLEVALAGGVLLACADGTLRDLAGLHGSYRPVVETEVALELVGAALAEAGPARATFYLDAPVSSSGRLAQRVRAHAAGWPLPVDVHVVPSPDRLLRGREHVVSSDSVVIDACASWVSLASWIVRRRVPHARIVELGGEAG